MNWNPEHMTAKQLSRIPKAEQPTSGLGELFWQQVQHAASEAQFQTLIISAAKYHGWLVQHSARIKTSKGQHLTPIHGDSGFPDLVLARHERIIFAELKAPRGRLQENQKRWAETLLIAQKCSPNLQWVLWKPEHAPLIREALE